MLSWLLTRIVSNEKPLSSLSLFHMECVSSCWLLFRFFSLSFVLSNCIIMCLGVDSLYFLCLEFIEYLWSTYSYIAFMKFGKTLKFFQTLFLFPPSFGDSNHMYIRPHKVVLQLTVTLSFFRSFLSLVSFWLIFITMSFGSLVFSAAIGDLLLISFHVFF